MADTCKSFLIPKVCGFRRAAAFLAVTLKEKTTREKYEDYCELFQERNEYLSFISNANRLKVTFQKWGKRKSTEKGIYIQAFNPKKFESLSTEEKNKHVFDNCESCQNNPELQRNFEANIKYSHKKNIIDENVSIDAATKTISSKEKKTLKDCTNIIYERINKPFEKKYGISFADSMAESKTFKLEKIATKYEKKKEKRRIIKQVTQKIEKDWESGAVERFVNIYFYFYMYIFHQHWAIRMHMYSSVSNKREDGWGGGV